MPEFLPDHLEAGTHNIAGLAGLLEGLRYVRRVGTQSIAARERRLIRQLGTQLKKLPGLEVWLAPDPEDQSEVLSFRAAEMDCEELGERLGDRGIALRAGLHCAPLAHQTAGTLETGTLRASVSAFNTEREIQQAASVVGRLLA